jgi:hypothetical protein
MGQLTNSLCRQGHTLGNMKRGDSRRQLLQRKGTQDDADLLHPAT